MRHFWQCVLIVSASMVLGVTGCTLKGTVKEITDTTSNITGTTSGAAWWSEDGQIKPDFKATAFVSFNHENLVQDVAAGCGEYLASISRLLGVPNDRQTAFSPPPRQVIPRWQIGITTHCTASGHPEHSFDNLI